MTTGLPVADATQRSKLAVVKRYLRRRPPTLRNLVWSLHGKADKIMADLTALTAAIDSLVSTDASVVTALDDLKAKIDAGGTVSQTDIDALRDKVTSAVVDMNSAIDRDDPPVVPGS